MLFEPCLRLAFVAPAATLQVFHQWLDVDALSVRSVLMALDVLQETCSGVIPTCLCLTVQHPTAFWVPIVDATRLAHGNVDVAEHGHQSFYVVRVAALRPFLNVAHHALIFLEHKVNVLFQQNVGVHQQESVWNQVEEFLNAHHVLVAAIDALAVHAMPCPFIFELGQLLVEVYQLTFGVVDLSFSKTTGSNTGLFS